MTKFAYNNSKIASTNHMLFELNCGYQPRIFFEEDTNYCPQPKTADKLLAELQKLMIVYQKNLHQA